MRSKPLIGITGPQEKSGIFWFFTEFAVRLGGGHSRRITLLDEAHIHACDGYVLMGGADINPALYGESALLPKLQYDVDRDAMEQHVIQHAKATCKPVLGICRGMQILNVTLGGTLFQEAKDVLEDFLPNTSLISKIIGRRKVAINKDSRLNQIMDVKRVLRVNSIHHQAVNKLGGNLKVVAREENGLVQAVETEICDGQSFMLGVQWHPELMLHSKHARRLFKALVREAGKKRVIPA